jgi:hypothetical protein
LRGTNAYAWPAEVLPVVLLAWGLWREGLRATRINISRFGLVWAQVAACLLLLIVPLVIASKGLTTISLSSCDAGDYAGGARVFMEFARTDRDGFIGLTEVVRVSSADNFFDFWLRLNHFTPSAVIAFNGSILHCAPHELTTLMTFVLLAGSLPLVFWVARAVLGYSGGVSLLVSLLYGISPITWYAAMQVAPGQLLAAQGIALVTWSGAALWRSRLTLRCALQFLATLIIAYWILLGSYNFIVLVCLIPAIAYAGGLAVWHGAWEKFGRWLLVMLIPFGITAGIFWGRVTDVVQRFVLLRTFDFGWHIAALTPEGWLGMVSGPNLEPWRFLGIRWLLALGVTIPFVWAYWRAFQQRRAAVWVVTSVTFPILVGYAFLEIRGRMLGTNASYDAYKLFAVFYPTFLAGMCWWVTLRRSRRLTEWFGVMGLAVFVIAVNVVAMGMFIWRMAQAPLIVDGELRQVRKVETRTDVASVNVLLDHMWDRLWANEFLLHKPQYFLTTSYEGRWATPLRGDWDLRNGLIAVRVPEPDSNIEVSQSLWMVRRTPHWLSASFGAGWNGEELLPGTRERWRWTFADAAEIEIENPHAVPMPISLVLDARSFAPREVTAQVVGGAATVAGNVRTQRTDVVFNDLVVPPGKHVLRLAIGPTMAPKPPDPRSLGICVWHVDVRVLDK